MASNLADSLTKRHEQEFARFKRGGKFSPIRVGVVGLAILISAILFLRLIGKYEGNSSSLTDARQDLISSAGEWGREFAENQSWYRTWMARHGTRVELSIFDRSSEALFHSAASFAAHYSSAESPGLFARVYLGLHSGAMRLIFLLTACTRLWLVIIGGFVFYGFRSIKPYQGRDALGQTGNGRIFFSGVRVALDEATPEGAPVDQVTGLACPGAISLVTAKTTPLAKLLEEFGAVTTTNLRLVAILEFYKNYPAYVALPDHEDSLDSFYEGSQLAENTERILRGALILHRAYRNEGDLSELAHINQDEVLRGVPQGRKVTAEEHAALAIEALDHVLTERFRHSLALLDAASIATIILSLEAGKSMAYCFEGGKWIRKSNFPQLCARSVLHSIPEFAQEYDFDLRMTIRRALIFGSRSSIFAPVKFPVDFREESRAARQWVEILMADPQHLAISTNEVQLLGLVTELHQEWEKAFFDGAVALDPAVIDQVFATPQDLICMPLTRLVQLMRRFVDRPTLQHLESLVTIVSQEQRRRAAAEISGTEGEDDRGSVPSYEKIFAPFSTEQVKELVDVHGLLPEDVRDWSSLRIILSSYGWLARRVGERSVPESSIVCATFAVDQDFPGANAFGLVGQIGMVPLRATRLEERWGKLWPSRFIQVGLARMAENRKDFELLLAGNDEESSSDTTAANAQGSGI